MTEQEALVEQIAQVVAKAMGRRHGPGIFDRDAARAVLPLVTAQVEAAVSVVRAEVERANQHADEWAATADRWTHRAAENGRRAGSAEADLRALREGLEALHVVAANPTDDPDWCKADGRNWPCPTIALLSPSPAEGTGDYGTPIQFDDNDPPPASVSSGEAAPRRPAPDCPLCDVAAFWRGDPCDHPAPAVTPSAEDGA